jgi:hypothetical protein
MPYAPIPLKKDGVPWAARVAGQTNKLTDSVQIIIRLLLFLTLFLILFYSATIDASNESLIPTRRSMQAV